MQSPATMVPLCTRGSVVQRTNLPQCGDSVSDVFSARDGKRALGAGQRGGVHAKLPKRNPDKKSATRSRTPRRWIAQINPPPPKNYRKTENCRHQYLSSRPGFHIRPIIGPPPQNKASPTEPPSHTHSLVCASRDTHSINSSSPPPIAPSLRFAFRLSSCPSLAPHSLPCCSTQSSSPVSPRHVLGFLASYPVAYCRHTYPVFSSSACHLSPAVFFSFLRPYHDSRRTCHPHTSERP